MSSTVAARRVWWLVLGFMLWSAAFLALYMTLTVGCAFGWHEHTIIAGLTLQRVVLVALFLVALVAAAALLRLAREHARGALEDSRPPAGFLALAGFWSTAAAFAATFATFAPVTVLSSCY